MRRTLGKKILSVSINLKACEYYHIDHKAVAPIVSTLLIELKLQELMSIHRPWVYISTQLHLFEWEISILNLHKHWKPEPVLQFTFNAHKMSDHKVYRNTLLFVPSQTATGDLHHMSYPPSPWLRLTGFHTSGLQGVQEHIESRSYWYSPTKAY